MLLNFNYTLIFRAYTTPTEKIIYLEEEEEEEEEKGWEKDLKNSGRSSILIQRWVSLNGISQVIMSL